jgi:aldehyde:ferredoxin oxidoreductase
MGTVDMRNEHDVIMDWVYDMDPEMEPFTEGTVKMEREDMQTALTMFYEEMGWDKKTGAPTKETLNRLGLDFAARELESMNLLP